MQPVVSCDLASFERQHACQRSDARRSLVGVDNYLEKLFVYEC